MSLNSENINMTDKEINDLANKIADIIFKRQEEYDAQFQVDIDTIVKNGGNISIASDGSFYNFQKPLSDEEYLLQLENELKKCIEQEDYNKASMLAGEIKNLKNKLNKDE